MRNFFLGVGVGMLLAAALFYHLYAPAVRTIWI